MMKEIGIRISSLLEKPAQVLILCLSLLFIGLISDGSVWSLYQIWKNQELISNRINEENFKISKIKNQLGQLKNPEYIEKQARERLEFLEKNDLLFVFSEE